MPTASFRTTPSWIRTPCPRSSCRITPASPVPTRARTSTKPPSGTPIGSPAKPAGADVATAGSHFCPLPLALFPRPDALLHILSGEIVSDRALQITPVGARARHAIDAASKRMFQRRGRVWLRRHATPPHGLHADKLNEQIRESETQGDRYYDHNRTHRLLQSRDDGVPKAISDRHG